MANLLSYLIIDELEEDLLSSIIQQNYCYFDAPERKKILNYCFDLFSEDFTNYFDKKFTYINNKFYLYLKEHKSIVITNIVHLIYRKKDSLLLDENKNIIPLDDSVYQAKYLSDISFSQNDYILNTLLTILPQKIYLHLIDNNIDEFSNTLLLIFEKKIEICSDCDICITTKTDLK